MKERSPDRTEQQRVANLADEVVETFGVDVVSQLVSKARSAKEQGLNGIFVDQPDLHASFTDTTVNVADPNDATRIVVIPIGNLSEQGA